MIPIPSSFPASIRQSETRSGLGSQLYGIAERDPKVLPLILDEVLPGWWMTSQTDSKKRIQEPQEPGGIRILVLTVSAMRGWEVMTALEASIKDHVEAQSEEESSSYEKDEEEEKLLTKRKQTIRKVKPAYLDEEAKSSNENKDNHKKQNKRPSVICLYGKHMKKKDQQRLLGGGTIYPAGVGTPGRLLSLLETSAEISELPNRKNRIIDISQTNTLIIDMYHDSKSFCLFTLHDTSNGFLIFYSLFSCTLNVLDVKHLLQDYFLPYIIEGKLKILLF